LLSSSFSFSSSLSKRMGDLGDGETPLANQKQRQGKKQGLLKRIYKGSVRLLLPETTIYFQRLSSLTQGIEKKAYESNF
jgi:hypothetical protein